MPKSPLPPPPEAFRIAHATPSPNPSAPLAVLSAAMLLSSLGTSIANVALPEIALSFHAPFGAVQWVVIAYILALTTLIVIVGRLGDSLGQRRLLLGGLLLFAGAAAAAGAASHLWVLIAARAVQGLGAAAMMVLTTAMVSRLVPPSRTGTAMGLLGTTSAIGTALGPSLGGALIASLGWRAVFLIHTPLTLAVFALARRHLPADPTARRSAPPPVDAHGAVWLTLALAAYALSATIGKSHFGPENAALLLFAAAGATAFRFVESKAAAPLIHPAVFRDTALLASLAMSALVSTVVMATLVIGPFYLSRTLALPPSTVGVVLSIGPAIAVLTGLPAGQWTDRFGSRPMTILGLAGMLPGTAALALVPETAGLPGYLLPIVFITAGYAVFQTANNTAVMTGTPADQRGARSGLLNLSRNLGLITGTSFMGTLFAAVTHTTTIASATPQATAAGLRTAFAAASILILLALALALSPQFAPRPRPTP